MKYHFYGNQLFKLRSNLPPYSYGTKWILTLFVFFSNPSYAQVRLKAGLIAYYPFTGNAVDSSGNNNNPVFNNTTLVPDRFGNKASACYFNGKNSYIQVKNNTSLSPEEFSLMAIVRPDGFYMGPCYNNAIIDKGAWDYRTGNYSLRFTAGEHTKGDCYNASLNYQNFVGATAFNDGNTSKNLYVKPGNWYCLVYTFSRQYSKLYVNGQLVSLLTTKGPVGKNKEDIFFGKKDNEQYPYWFKGVIDEIRIYNRPISEEEVIALCAMLPESKIANPPCLEINKPSANFTYAVSACNKVNFDLKAGNSFIVKTIKWVFGDGSTSTEFSPDHTYAKYGRYKVRAIAANEFNCNDTVTREIEVKELNTDFVYSEEGEPGEILFKAKNNNALYSWNFGDGNMNKNEAAASHVYQKTGQYLVKMFAQNNTGCKDTVQKKIDIVLPSVISNATSPAERVKIAAPMPDLQLEKRNKDVVRTIVVENNSISLSLYDNGIIDGDSITLIYNDRVILSHQLLSNKALTIHLAIDPERASNELAMYAENLGSIPPNTALMIINDGDKRYEVSMSSSKSSNSVISFAMKNNRPIFSQ